MVLSDVEQIDARLSGREWRLAYVREGETVLAYEGNAASALRIECGLGRPYRFRSVEQLRYDFDRDLRMLRDEDGP